VQDAKQILEREDVVAIPTETIWFSGNIYSQTAIKKYSRRKIVLQPADSPY
jgi:tRNA A37 threonylcarbamoyladenosine synthetase subunit TsaC/SUA5/YrdC